jgi:hypothetical protein
VTTSSSSRIYIPKQSEKTLFPESKTSTEIFCSHLIQLSGKIRRKKREEGTKGNEEQQVEGKLENWWAPVGAHHCRFLTCRFLPMPHQAFRNWKPGKKAMRGMDRYKLMFDEEEELS